MSEPVDAHESGSFMPRWIFFLAVPAMVAPLLIFGFILRTEMAHDESTCPYREVKRIRLAHDVQVVEEARSCLDGVEEHRYLALRGQGSRLLGRRRFGPGAFAAEVYRWQAVLAETGEVVIHIENDGQNPALYREGTEQERRTGVPRRPAE